MGDIKLFRIENGKARELENQTVAKEKSLQSQMEKNLKELLGVEFLESEYRTGRTHKGRIDTLGIDDTGCPVIIEYKKDLKENVINQGLFYLDWLLDHKAEFEALVRKKFGDKKTPAVEWGSPRLLCIAGDFTRYDEHAVSQIGRNIELIRYSSYGNDLMLLELVNMPFEEKIDDGGQRKKVEYRRVSDALSEAPAELVDLFDSLKSYIESLGEDVQTKVLKQYVAFRRLNNFASVEIRTQNRVLVVYLKVDPKMVIIEEGFTRDMTNLGHWGPGDLEVIIRKPEDLERAKHLINRGYENG